ncbi:hypothetical protein MUP01_09295 [Candidatus Bathyarchaeota archaeon]|nr:hypothetical protein [Candidatus Bathyarchaeota archaeon]
MEGTSLIQMLKKTVKGLKPKLLLIILVGFSIRFAVAPFTEHRYDMHIWRVNQALVYEYHTNPFFPPPGTNATAYVLFWSYTPFWLFTLLPLYPIYASIAHPVYDPDPQELWQNGLDVNSISESYHSFIPSNLPLLTTLIKLPIIMSDLLIALLVFKIVEELAGEKKAYYASLIWLLNPYVIWISSIWGMFDSIPTLFTVLAFYFFVKAKYEKSAVSLAVATLFKIYPIMLAPVLALTYYKQKRSATASFRYCAICGGTVLLVSFLSYFGFALAFGQEPFSNAATLLLQLFRGRASPDWYGKNLFFGLTPLGILGTVFDQLHLDLNIPVVPLLIILATVVLLAMIARKKEFATSDVLSYVILTHLAIYLTYSVVNEQYLIWILPFLLVMAAIQKKPFMEYFYWGVSILAMLYIVYHYANLTYFVSPYFIPRPEEHGLYIPLETAAISLGLALFYIVGMKIALRRES